MGAAFLFYIQLRVFFMNPAALLLASLVATLASTFRTLIGITVKDIFLRSLVGNFPLNLIIVFYFESIRFNGKLSARLTQTKHQSIYDTPSPIKDWTTSMTGILEFKKIDYPKNLFITTDQGL